MLKPAAFSSWDGVERPAMRDWLDEAFDFPAPTEPPKKLLICGAQRTSSTRLARLLYAAGLGIPVEYYHRKHAGTLGRRWGLAPEPIARGHPLIRHFPPRLRRRLQAMTTASVSPKVREWSRHYTRRLLQARSPNGIFTSKLQFWQMQDYLLNDIGRELFEGATVVFLTRLNPAAQTVSLVASSVARTWDFADTGRSDREAKVVGKDVVRASRILSAEEANWRRFLALCDTDPICLLSEEINREPAQAVRTIAAGMDQAIDEEKLERMIELDSRYVTTDMIKPRIRAAKKELGPDFAYNAKLYD